jgi:DNA modification methylase
LGCNDRNYIGFELNEKYAEFSKVRLSWKSKPREYSKTC